MRAPGDLATDQSELESDEAWNRLALATPQPDPFCSTTHWQLSWREAIEPRRPLLVQRSEDGLVHLVQHRLSDTAAFGPIERSWLFGCNLLGPAALDLLGDLLANLAEEVRASAPIVISGLDPVGQLLTSLKARFASAYAIERFRHEFQCAASLEGGLDGFLSRRSGNFRRNLRRAEKRAAEVELIFERYAPTSAQEADAVFDRMLAVEWTSWKGLSRSGMDAPTMVRFYSTMLRRLARTGDARVIMVKQDESDVGFIFGGRAGGFYRGQQFSFDEDWAAFSIGNLMQFEQVKWLCEEGASRYDLGPLLGPSMEYKHRWTELQLPIEAWILKPR